MKEAKFFCDSCGAEVDREARTCPSCGRLFTSVRCPRCGKTGPSGAFKRGCPVCGYSKPPEAEPRPAKAAPGPLPVWALCLAIAAAAAVVIGIVWALRPAP